MDILSQHEAFLRAIFDAPDDDTPRLVYADFLQENGEEDRAAFIRVSCEHKRLLKYDRGSPERERLWDVIRQQVEVQRRLAAKDPEAFSAHGSYERGFPLDQIAGPYWVTLDNLASATTFRERIIYREPYVFGRRAAGIGGGRIIDTTPLDVFFGLAVFARVTELDLRGSQDAVKQDDVDGDDTAEYTLTEYVLKPRITTLGVEALARHRGVRRIERLDLTNNDLDNDAARALVKSPYLDNLKRLQLLEGNRLRGKVWQQVIERFGEDVVG